MSEESEVLTLEQLQEMAAEQDRMSGYEEGGHPAMQGPQEVQARLQKQEAATEDAKSSDTARAKEAEAVKPKDKEPPKAEPETDLSKEPPEVDTGSLKEGENADKLGKSEKRLNEAWKKVNSDKEENRRIRAELEELREQLNDRAKPEAYVDKDGNTAEDYEAAASNFEAEGEMALAEQARNLANEVRGQAQESANAKADQNFKEQWSNNFDKAADSYPELTEADSGFRKAVDTILKDRPVLATYPEGILDAADLVAMQIKAGSASELQNQIAALKEENGDLRSKLSIGGSDPSGSDSTAGPTAFEQMSNEEQFLELQRRAAEADAQVGGY